MIIIIMNIHYKRYMPVPQHENEEFSILDMKSISIGHTRQRIKTQTRIINAYLGVKIQ